MKTGAKTDNYNGKLQRPIGSKFNGKTTASEVVKGIDLRGKIAVVTGGNSGIGLETTKTLAGAGATVVVPARDIKKAEKNLKGIANVEIAAMDLIDHHSIDAFAKGFLASGRPLHLLINNAGIMWVPLRRDARGFESQLVTNYLAQFQLVASLWPALRAANGARVINVSSYGHQMSPFNFVDPNFETTEYQTLTAYGNSKTASILFALELDSRAKAFNVRSYSLHPGSINGTELGREASLETFQKLGFLDENGNMNPALAEKLKTIPQGAATTVWCATSSLLEGIGGVYCENCDVAVLDKGDLNPRYDDPTTQIGVREYAVNGEYAGKLWALTEGMTGIVFNPA